MMKKDSTKTSIEPAYNYIGIYEETDDDEKLIRGNEKYHDPVVFIYKYKINEFFSHNKEKKDEEFLMKKSKEIYPDRLDVFELFLDMSNELLLTQRVEKIDNIDIKILRTKITSKDG